MSSIDDLYQETILDHNRHPKNFRSLPHATHKAEGFNPVCGDHYTVYVVVDDQGVIRELSFEGVGCAISKSSASLMTQALVGRTLAEGEALFQAFHNQATGQAPTPAETALLGKLRVFAGVSKYPARVKCAILGWHAFHAALAGGGKATTE